ncbi:hypothetical protein Tco_0353635 [Tanacetum coccineum]
MEMPAVQADLKKSENAAVQDVYKKNCRLFPSDMSLRKIPLKDKTLEVKSVEKSNSKGIFPSDMSLGIMLIILNNEHNEPTQGDIGETSNEPTQATRNEFEELYSSANEALYPGCGHVTRLDFMTKFTFFKVRKSIHACEHDCCLFRGEVNKDLQFCPVYNTSRWKDSDTPGKKVPRKVLRYFPIIPRLQRLYKSRHTAKDMIWHATGKCTEPGKMQHPVDGGAWKKFDMKYPDLQNRTRNVRLRVVCDGSIVQQTLVRRYSMWPVLLTITICIRGFMQTRKRFLRKLHKWRSSREFNGDTDHRDPPKEYPRDVILAQHARCLSRVPGKACVVEGVEVALSELSGSTLATMVEGCHRGREQPDLYIWINNPDLPPSIRGEEWIMSPSYDLHYRGESRRWLMLHEHMAGVGGGVDPSRPLLHLIRLCGWLHSIEEMISEYDLESQFGRRKNPAGRPRKDPEQVFKDAGGANKGRPRRSEGPPGGQGEDDGHLGSTYNLEPHMRSERWPRIEGYIQALRGKPDEYTDDEWEKYINFWNDPANAQRAETNRLNRSKSTVVSRHGSRSIPLTRHLMDRMRELEATGEHTTAEINAMVRGGKLRGHIPGVGPPAEWREVACVIVRRRGGDDTRGSEDGGDGNELASICRYMFISMHQFLDQKIRGVHFSLGIVAGERFAIELTHQLFPSDISLGIDFPSDMSLAKGSECCWGKHRML